MSLLYELQTFSSYFKSKWPLKKRLGICHLVTSAFRSQLTLDPDFK